MSIIFKQGTHDYPINSIEEKDGNEDSILSTARVTMFATASASGAMRIRAD